MESREKQWTRSTETSLSDDRWQGTGTGQRSRAPDRRSDWSRRCARCSLATAGAYAPRRPYPRGVRRQVRRAAEARPERSWTGRLWQPIRTLYKREQLLDDWSEMQAPRRTPRIKKLDRGANATWSERDQDAVARADMRAVDRDWKRLEKAIAYLPKEERGRAGRALIVAHGAHAARTGGSGEPFVSHPSRCRYCSRTCRWTGTRSSPGCCRHGRGPFLQFEDVERRFGPDVRALVDGGA